MSLPHRLNLQLPLPPLRRHQVDGVSDLLPRKKLLVAQLVRVRVLACVELVENFRDEREVARDDGLLAAMLAAQGIPGERTRWPFGAAA